MVTGIAGLILMMALHSVMRKIQNVRLIQLPKAGPFYLTPDHPERTQMAMQSVDKYLINRDKGLIQLLEPPFDTSDLDPGYIKGYVPGVRENGGQYTHAAIWMVMAFAKMGDQQHTWELLNMINPINHGKSAEDVCHL